MFQENYKQKYLKYKHKYLLLKNELNIIGGKNLKETAKNNSKIRSISEKVLLNNLISRIKNYSESIDKQDDKWKYYYYQTALVQIYTRFDYDIRSTKNGSKKTYNTEDARKYCGNDYTIIPEIIKKYKDARTALKIQETDDDKKIISKANECYNACLNNTTNLTSIGKTILSTATLGIF